MKNIKNFLIGILILILSGAVFYLLVGNPFRTHSEFDIVDQENDKIISMFNRQIEKEIDNHTQSTYNPGYIKESRQHTIDYLNAIKTIESYARKGVTSTQPRNYIELRITFQDGTVADKVYTGYSCNGYTAPELLLKVEMQDGKATRVFTNGQERKGAPDDIYPMLSTVIDRAISYDIERNAAKYFGAQKTQQDYDKEWEDQK